MGKAKTGAATWADTPASRWVDAVPGTMERRSVTVFMIRTARRVRVNAFPFLVAGYCDRSQRALYI